MYAIAAFARLLSGQLVEPSGGFVPSFIRFALDAWKRIPVRTPIGGQGFGNGCFDCWFFLTGGRLPFVRLEIKSERHFFPFCGCTVSVVYPDPV